MRERCTDHAHSENARKHKVNVIDPSDISDILPHDRTKDKDVEKRADPRRNQGLHSHPQKSSDFLVNERTESDPVNIHNEEGLLKGYFFRELQVRLLELAPTIGELLLVTQRHKLPGIYDPDTATEELHFFKIVRGEENGLPSLV